MKNNRWKAALAVVLLLSSPLAAAAISFPLPWHQGMKVRYQSVSVQEKTRAGKHERVETRENNTLEIVEASDQAYLQVWHSIAPSVVVSGDADNVAVEKSVAQKLTKRFANLPMKVELDSKGGYLGIRNWEVLAIAMREVMLPVLVQQAHARPGLEKTDDAKLTEMLKPALMQLTTQQAIENTLGKQAAIFNFFTAPTLTPGKPVSYEDSMASPWSADVLPSTGSFELIAVDDQAGTATIRWQQSIDPVKGAEIVWKMIEAIAGKTAAGAAHPAGLPQGLKLSDTATVVLDRKSGLPLSIKHQREVALGDSSAVSTWTFTKLPDQAAP
jgi:hypothetical protein